MAKNKYDIFISYRRTGGAQYARILQLMLIQRGYKVFLDYDELTDGVFGDHIKAAIKEAPVFMLVLSERSMERCVNEDDWVRQEILFAIQEGKHLVPVNPDNSFNGFPEDKGEKIIPKEIRENISSHQFSEIGFGQTLGVTIDLMIKNRLVPTLGERNNTDHVDTDYVTAQETLRKINEHNHLMKRLGITGVAAVLLIFFGTCLWFWLHQKQKELEEVEKVALEELRTKIQERHKVFGLQFSPNMTATQMNTIDTLLQTMTVVRPDTLWMSQFEFTVNQWYSIKGETFDESQKHLPMTNISYGEIFMFLGNLSDMTNLNITLPSVEDWDYAAHGGYYNETTLYVGNDNVDKVAWYKDNSGGYPHPSDGQQGKEPNKLDLYDMSGNVSEICNTPFDASGLYTICGGSFDSPASEVTVTSRKGFATNAKNKTVGFRIIIRKEHL